jgi:hypothetical protein
VEAMGVEVLPALRVDLVQLLSLPAEILERALNWYSIYLNPSRVHISLLTMQILDIAVNKPYNIPTSEFKEIIDDCMDGIEKKDFQ